MSKSSEYYIEFKDCIADLLDTEVVRSMDRFSHHIDSTCLEHSIFVSYVSFRICRALGFDSYTAARGALLHDLFLYDWRDGSSHEGPHAFRHPGIALKNAQAHFELGAVERDIIKKHMWPLTPVPPRYKESAAVCFADKICATIEISQLINKMKVHHKIEDLIHVR